MAHESQGRQSAQDAHDHDITPLSPNGTRSGSIPPVQAGAPIAGAASEVLQRFWEAVRRLPAYVRLATSIARDPEVPKQAKAVLAFGGGYAVSPIDLVPGIIPVAGQMDDLYVLLTSIQQALKMMPEEVAARHLAAANIRREEIDGDLQAVRELVRKAVVKSVKVGGKALGRISRAAVQFANQQFKRRNAGRAEEPL